MSIRTWAPALFFAALFSLAACGPAAPFGYGPTPPSGGDATCSTASYWQRGNSESEHMHPGGNCISCHTQEGEGPRYEVAGTIMGAVDDADDCQGVGDVTVELLDPDGNVSLTMVSGEAGNFFSRDGLSAAQLPYTVRLTYDGRTSEMVTEQTDTNCMTCHTQEGASAAPGRILVP